MRHNLSPSPELKAIARQIFLATEAFMQDNSIGLPFPQTKDLPWGVQTMQSSIDSAGGAWKVGQACKKRSGLVVIASVELREGGLWYHISLSRDGKMPSYQDMAWVKELWMGDRWAIQCFVPKGKHVNIHPHCLHLWHNLTGKQPFPDFAAEGHI